LSSFLFLFGVLKPLFAIWGTVGCTENAKICKNLKWQVKRCMDVLGSLGEVSGGK